MIIGFQRAAFSNEAGLGSAAIAHSAVKTRHPVTEGFVAMLEPFIDTVIICTATALTIVIANTQTWQDQREVVAETGELPAGGVTLTSRRIRDGAALVPVRAHRGCRVVRVCPLPSPGRTTACRHGPHCSGAAASRRNFFNTMFCVFTVIGTVLSLGSVLDFADATLFLLALVNITGLYFLLPVVKRELAGYLATRRGERDEESVDA